MTRHTAYPGLTRRAAILGLGLALAGCAARGTITIAPEAAAKGSVVDLLVATTRGYTDTATIAARARSETLRFADFAVSVPARPHARHRHLPERRAEPRDRLPHRLRPAARLRPRLRRRRQREAGAAPARGARGHRLRPRLQHELRRRALPPRPDDPRLPLARRLRLLRLALRRERRLLRLRPRKRALRARRAGTHARPPRAVERATASSSPGTPWAPSWSWKPSASSPSAARTACSTASRRWSSLPPTSTPSCSGPRWARSPRASCRSTSASRPATGRSASRASCAASPNGWARSPTPAPSPLCRASSCSTVAICDGSGDPLNHFAVATSPAMVAFIGGLDRVGPTMLRDEDRNVGVFTATLDAVRRRYRGAASPPVALGRAGQSFAATAEVTAATSAKDHEGRRQPHGGAKPPGGGIGHHQAPARRAPAAPRTGPAGPPAARSGGSGSSRASAPARSQAR